MSDLEEATIPVLEPLIVGKAGLISKREQKTLATWAIKTALALNETGGDDAVRLPQVFYTTLAKTRSPPPMHQVFASYVRNEDGEGRYHGFGLIRDPTDHETIGYFGIVLIGHIVFQVLCNESDPFCPAFDAHYYVRLWPVREKLDWPGVSIPRPRDPTELLTIPPDWPTLWPGPGRGARRGQ
jgi:hypothetical protein